MALDESVCSTPLQDKRQHAGVLIRHAAYRGLGQQLVDRDEDAGVEHGHPLSTGPAHSDTLPLQTGLTPGTGPGPQPALAVQLVLTHDFNDATKQTQGERTAF